MPLFEETSSTLSADRIRVEVVACKHCRALAVLIGDTRVTSHKCAGQWEVLCTERVSTRLIVDALLKSPPPAANADAPKETNAP
jgi:hypothetical protein